MPQQHRPGFIIGYVDQAPQLQRDVDSDPIGHGTQPDCSASGVREGFLQVELGGGPRKLRWQVAAELNNAPKMREAARRSENDAFGCVWKQVAVRSDRANEPGEACASSLRMLAMLNA